MYAELAKHFFPMTAEQVAVMAPFCADVAKAPSHKWGPQMLAKCEHPETMTAVDCVKIMTRLGIAFMRKALDFDDVETLKALKSGLYDGFKPAAAETPAAVDV